MGKKMMGFFRDNNFDLSLLRLFCCCSRSGCNHGKVEQKSAHVY